MYQNNSQSVDANIADTVCQRQYFFGQHRFYIPQENARQLDRLFNRNFWDTSAHQRKRAYRFEVVYSCVQGEKPIAKQLLIEGMDWRQFLKERNR